MPRKKSEKWVDLCPKEPKSSEWFRIKEEIFPYFVANNIHNICELGLSMCIGTALPLQFAHAKKRIDIAIEEPQRTIDLKMVVRACTACHNYIETLPDKDGKTGHERMYDIVSKTIARRERRINRWKLIK